MPLSGVHVPSSYEDLLGLVRSAGRGDSVVVFAEYDRFGLLKPSSLYEGSWRSPRTHRFDPYLWRDVVLDAGLSCTVVAFPTHTVFYGQNEMTLYVSDDRALWVHTGLVGEVVSALRPGGCYLFSLSPFSLYSFARDAHVAAGLPGDSLQSFHKGSSRLPDHDGFGSFNVEVFSEAEQFRYAVGVLERTKKG